MKKIKIIISLFICFLLTGCYNYRELNDLAITSAIGINKSGDDFELIIQVVNNQKQSSEGGSAGEQLQFVVYKTKGKTIQEALRSIILESPKRLYLNHTALLVISEEVAKEGIGDIMDIFARDSEFRKQFMVLISKNDETEDVISTVTALETLNAKNIKDSLKTDNKYLGSSTIVTFENLLSAYLNNKIDIALPSVIMKGNEKTSKEEDNIKESEPSAKVVLDDLAIFDNKKLVGYLDKKDSINASIINNDINNTIYTYKCDNNKYLSIEIIDSKTEVKTPSDKEEININIKQKANINETTCNIDLEKQEDLDKLEKEISKQLKKEILKTINKTIKEYNSDIFGFEDTIYKDNPSYYKKLKEKYHDEILNNLEFKVDVSLNLYAKGNVLKEI